MFVICVTYDGTANKVFGLYQDELEAYEELHNIEDTFPLLYGSGDYVFEVMDLNESLTSWMNKEFHRAL